MVSTLRSLFAVTLGVGFVQLACSSTTRNKVSDDADDGTSTTATSTTATSFTSFGAGGTVGIAGPTSTSASATSSTSTTSSTSSEGVGGTSTGSTSTGSTSTTGGGGTDVDFRPMACNEGDPGCVCDENGCLIDNGGPCTRSEDCLNGFCGVTQDATNVCCAAACDADQVCAADGSACEAEEQCAEHEHRCNTDYQRCTGGVWETAEACGARGCDLDFGGCLLPVGAACSDDTECGEGTCQPVPGGAQVCCTASCGACELCGESGTDCAVPPLSELGPECACTDDDLSNCADNASCTTEVCNDGVCANPVQPGYCLIDGECYAQNAPEPSNPCRYCDTGFSQVSWTNSGSSTACNDGRYCNGADFCDGNGACAHEFTGNRCSGNAGVCDSTTCDETRDTCLRPDGYACDSWTELRCSSSSCGGDPQERSITRYCSGFSAECNGDVENGDWVNTSNCSGEQKCDASSYTCQEGLGCGSTFCDSATNKCWTMDRAGGGVSRTHDEAVAYCNSLELGGRDDWRLPTIQEFIAASRGCNGITGEPESVDYYPDCKVFTDTLADCATCPEGSGPTDGCYSVTGWAPCDDLWAHITDTPTGRSSEWFTFSFRQASVGFTPFSADVRCVLDL